jgi:hypothetical protein
VLPFAAVALLVIATGAGAGAWVVVRSPRS